MSQYIPFFILVATLIIAFAIGMVFLSYNPYKD